MKTLRNLVEIEVHVTDLVLVVDEHNFPLDGEGFLDVWFVDYALPIRKHNLTKVHTFKPNDPIVCYECGWSGEYRHMIHTHKAATPPDDVYGVDLCPECMTETEWHLDHELLADDGDVRPEYNEDDWRVER